MGSHRGERVYEMEGEKERKRRREAETFLGGKMSNRNEVKRLSSVKRV